ncbi:MAG: ribonuclease R [Pseudomonadota bacterium]
MGKKKKRFFTRSRSSRKRMQSTFVGRIQKNQRGFAFVIPHDHTLKDTYVSPREARSLMNGDIVEYQVEHLGKRTSAKIVKVLERACKKVLGKVQGSGRQFFIESSEGDLLSLENGERNQVGSWVIAKIKHYPSDREMGTATITDKLGQTLTPKFDHLITISRFGIEEGFPPAALREIEDLRQAAQLEIQKPSPQRKDLRHLPFVTIDGEDAKNFDDAICVSEHAETGEIKLLVAIADVSYFVRAGSQLDEEAKRRSTSIYFPGYCIPMLPEDLSNDLCSLNPQTDKLVLVAEINFSPSGRILSTHFFEGIIKTIARLTYTKVHHWFQGSVEAVPTECHRPLESAKRLFNLLLGQRKERGVLDFQLPECRFELDQDGNPIKAYPFPSWEAHRLIEEFMVMANSVVAKALKENNCPSLYRVHEAPMIESIEDLNQLMKSLGFSLMLKEVSPLAFSKVLLKTTGQKGAHTLHKAILRAQKQARYEPEPKGHFGLSLTDYTHFTSPIRRYPDLIVHRSLKSFILRQGSADKDNNSEALVKLGELTSERERRAMEAERFITRRKQCWFMADKIGEPLKGTVSGVIEKGLFIELSDYAIEGFVPIESLNGYYEFDERRGCLRRRPGHTTLSIGDPMDVQVAAVSVEDNEITFFPLQENS